jgi:DNA polymerase-1
VDVTFLEALTEQVSEAQVEAVEEEAPMLRNLSLLDTLEDAERAEVSKEREHFVAVSAEEGRALRISLTSPQGARLRESLEDAAVPKAVHDLKATVRALDSHGITIANVRDDLMLYSYLINPTHIRAGGGDPPVVRKHAPRRGRDPSARSLRDDRPSTRAGASWNGARGRPD